MKKKRMISFEGLITKHKLVLAYIYDDGRVAYRTDAIDNSYIAFLSTIEFTIKTDTRAERYVNNESYERCGLELGVKSCLEDLLYSVPDYAAVYVYRGEGQWELIPPARPYKLLEKKGIKC